MPVANKYAQGRIETAQRLVALCDVATRALQAVTNGARLSAEEAESARALLKQAEQPTAAAVEFPFLAGLGQLIAAAQ
jgi:hypothetical protein